MDFFALTNTSVASSRIVSYFRVMDGTYEIVHMILPRFLASSMCL